MPCLNLHMRDATEFGPAYLYNEMQLLLTKAASHNHGDQPDMPGVKLSTPAQRFCRYLGQRRSIAATQHRGSDHMTQPCVDM